MDQILQNHWVNAIDHPTSPLPTRCLFGLIYVGGPRAFIREFPSWRRVRILLTKSDWHHSVRYQVTWFESERESENESQNESQKIILMYLFKCNIETLFSSTLIRKKTLIRLIFKETNLKLKALNQMQSPLCLKNWIKFELNSNSKRPEDDQQATRSSLRLVVNGLCLCTLFFTYSYSENEIPYGFNRSNRNFDD